VLVRDDLPLVDGRPLKERVGDALQKCAAELKILNRGLPEQAQAAFAIIAEVTEEDGGQGWLYISNAREPVPFIADAVEQIEDEMGWDAPAVN
jgi:hypothetical protein